ncbi:MAG: hypothetical protein ACI319_10575 [Holdemanella porci]
MKVRAFITHKLNECYSDCQDRFSINKERRTLAVSDGMSQSVFPDFWADILSQYYASHGHCNEMERKSLCEQWLQKVEQYQKQEIEAGRNPSWRINNILHGHDSAGATLCGVEFENANNWNGHVLGDSCIIEIDWNSNQVVKIHTSQDKPFDCYPDYFDSSSKKKGKGEMKPFSGSIDENHSLLLVSDPFSEFLYNNKLTSSYWLQKIKVLGSHQDFVSLVNEWRQEGLHNDDSTLCIIDYDGKDVFDIKFDDIQKLIQEETCPSKVLQIDEQQPIEENEGQMPPEGIYNSLSSSSEPIGYKNSSILSSQTIESNDLSVQIEESKHNRFIDEVDKIYKKRIDRIVRSVKSRNKLSRAGKNYLPNELKTFKDDILSRFNEIFQ